VFLEQKCRGPNDPAHRAVHIGKGRRSHAMLHRRWQLRGSLCLALGQPAGRRCRRYLIPVGVLPALLTLWIRSSIPESEKWKQINEQRKTVRERQCTGAELPPEERSLTLFTVADLFVNAESRRRAMIARSFYRSRPRLLGGTSRRGCRHMPPRLCQRPTCRRNSGPRMPGWLTISAVSSAMSPLAFSPTGRTPAGAML
jgi:hypothetical protein